MPESDAISSAIGDVGRYQVTRFVLILLVSVPGLCHIFAVIFSTVKTDFWCDDFPLNNDTKNECIQDCSSYSFDTSFWKRTLISDYEMVCSRDPFLLTAKIVIFSGYAVGTLLAGFLSDYMGRKAAISFFSQLLFGSGIIATVMPNVTGFIAVWFFVGISAIAVYTVATVWTMEMLSGKWRTVFGFVIGFAWPVARLLTALIAYVTADWRIMLQIFSGVHILTPLALHFVCESPRWLISTGNKSKVLEAKSILDDIAKKNGRQNVSVNMNELEAGPVEQRENIWIIFKTAVLLKRTLIIWVNWFSVSFIIYGLNLNWQTLTGSVFLNFVVSSVLDFPTKAAGIWINMRFGRRLPYIGFVAFSGVMLFLILAFEKDEEDPLKNWPIALLGLIGALCISLAFSITWVYTAELYPTGIRNAGVGAGSMLARIGGIFATTLPTLSEKVDERLPPILFGCAAFISAFLTTFLPETGGQPLPKDVDEIKAREEDDRRNGTWTKLKRATTRS